MSNKRLLLGRENARMGYSAAYPTGRERIVFRRKERKGRKDLNHEIHEMIVAVRREKWRM